ncbi:hypothetical protein EDC01DRAFT_263606 [Geopyxis carbonaria]|nr:hypothetical protein EDC01DRAFT_263606 [Geopyxis carbonaria]
MPRPLRRTKSSFLVPLAITATRDRTRDQPTTSSSTSQTAAPAQPRGQPVPDYKPSIALVVRESSSASALLSQLPAPLSLARANVFVLLYAPELGGHPLSDSNNSDSSGEGRVYRQARALFAKDVPREMVMPYTDRKSLVPMLKQIAPECVFVEGALVSGEGEGTVGAVLEGKWVGGLVVANVGGEVPEEEGRRWGKRCRVVEVGEVAEEWRERVG